jgi:hypothetical protein
MFKRPAEQGRSDPFVRTGWQKLLKMACRKAAGKSSSQRGGSERDTEAYCTSYAEAVSDATTKLEDRFNIR